MKSLTGICQAKAMTYQNRHPETLLVPGLSKHFENPGAVLGLQAEHGLKLRAT